MTETLELVANVITVIDLSVKIVSRCSEYYVNVKNVRDDIERLRRGAQGLKAVLERIQILYDGPNDTKFQKSQSLRKRVKDY